jgi:hypothetical protein
METLLSDLSGSELRKLMIRQLKQFILLLDTGKTEELQHQKAYLTEIFACLSEKEQEEVQHLVSLVSKLSLSADLQLHSENTIVVPAFDTAHSALSASPGRLAPVRL